MHIITRLAVPKVPLAAPESLEKLFSVSFSHESNFEEGGGQQVIGLV